MTNKYEDVIQIIGEEGAEWLLDSGSSYGKDVFFYDKASGTFQGLDPYIKQEVIEDLWKCIACGKVYKLSEHLECERCGTPVTEKSRFVLE
jgi:DNA-directed RNA polymerase subunit RPC12/RpoP